ncbi:acetyl-CoA carboxylase biotin carboxyl carrier protein [Peribacillus frigoritolerans]|uniref:acetyl-CoA carboxylase biotin carboxyl carrier protein n=1 Tax=Peribacillus frigoritolerans TaxID=450367 RepID=UPI0020C0BE73|nr:biotin/lipoyl-containing protein [Peribacillus frigoritolerans]
MAKILEIREMVRLVDQSSLHKLEVKNDSYRVSIKKAEAVHELPVGDSNAQIIHAAELNKDAAAEVSEGEQNETEKLHVLQSGNVGIVQSLAKSGDEVEVGSLIGHCIVESLNLDHEITSDINGVINEVLVEEGQLIEYGQPLYKITIGKELVHV